MFEERTKTRVSVSNSDSHLIAIKLCRLQWRLFSLCSRLINGYQFFNVTKGNVLLTDINDNKSSYQPFSRVGVMFIKWVTLVWSGSSWHFDVVIVSLGYSVGVGWRQLLRSALKKTEMLWFNFFSCMMICTWRIQHLKVTIWITKRNKDNSEPQMIYKSLIYPSPSTLSIQISRYSKGTTSSLC